MPNGVLKWGYENFTPFIQPILEQYGVDLVFQGHSHDYEVYHPPWKGSDAEMTICLGFLFRAEDRMIQKPRKQKYL